MGKNRGFCNKIIFVQTCFSCSESGLDNGFICPDVSHLADATAMRRFAAIGWGERYKDYWQAIPTLSFSQGCGAYPPPAIIGSLRVCHRL